MFCRCHSLNRISFSMPTRNNKVSNKLRMSICYHLFLTCSPVTIVMDFRGKTVKNASIKGLVSKKFLQTCGWAQTPSPTSATMCDPNMGNTALPMCEGQRWIFNVPTILLWYTGPPSLGLVPKDHVVSQAKNLVLTGNRTQVCTVRGKQAYHCATLTN